MNLFLLSNILLSLTEVFSQAEVKCNTKEICDKMTFAFEFSYVQYDESIKDADTFLQECEDLLRKIETVKTFPLDVNKEEQDLKDIQSKIKLAINDMQDRRDTLAHMKDGNKRDCPNIGSLNFTPASNNAVLNCEARIRKLYEIRDLIHYNSLLRDSKQSIAQIDNKIRKKIAKFYE